MPKTKRRRRVRRIEISPKSMLWAVLIASGCWLLIRLAPVALALIVALFLIGTLSPAVEWLERRRHMRRGRAIGLVFTLLLLVTLSLGALTLPQLFSQGREVVQHAPELRARLVSFLSHSPMLRPLADDVRDFRVSSVAKGATGSVLTASATVAEYIGYLLSAIFLALYMMFDRDRLRGGLFAVMPREYHIRLSRVLLNLETIVGGYIRGQALTCGMMAVFAFILLTVCGIPNALALAVFAGVADVLPYIGPTLSIAPMALTAAGEGWVPAVIVISVMLAYEEFESRFLIPRVYGRTLRLPSSMVLLALLVGGTLMGIVGALLALPLAAAIRMIVQEWRVELPGESVDDGPQRARDAEAEQQYVERTEGAPASKAAAIALEMSEEQLKHEERNEKAAD